MTGTNRTVISIRDPMGDLNISGAVFDKLEHAEVFCKKFKENSNYSYVEVSRVIQYEITKFGQHHYLSIFLLAKDEVDAILKACQKRDELQASGDFPWVQVKPGG